MASSQVAILSKTQAHWVDAETIAWDVDYHPDNTYSLHHAPEGGMVLENGAVAGGEQVELTYDAAVCPRRSRPSSRTWPGLPPSSYPADSTPQAHSRDRSWSRVKRPA